MTSQTKEQIHKDWVAKSQRARQQQAHLNLLNSYSEADRKSVELLEQIDIASGGKLDRLVAVYRSIKANS